VRDEEEKERINFTSQLRTSALNNEKLQPSGSNKSINKNPSPPENNSLLSPRTPLKTSRKIDGTNMPTIIV